MRGSRWLWIALALSVALNLFFAGMHLGGGLSDHRRSGRAGGLPPGFESLSAADQTIVRDRFRLAMAAGREDRRAAREARRRAAAALAAEPLDRGRVEAALAEARQRHAESRLRADTALVTAAADLSPEGRRRLARLLSRGPRGEDRRPRG
jgi:uncharacterized membrane protein